MWGPAGFCVSCVLPHAISGRKHMEKGFPLLRHHTRARNSMLLSVLERRLVERRLRFRCPLCTATATSLFLSTPHGRNIRNDNKTRGKRKCMTLVRLLTLCKVYYTRAPNSLKHASTCGVAGNVDMKNTLYTRMARSSGKKKFARAAQRESISFAAALVKRTAIWTSVHLV